MESRTGGARWRSGSGRQKEGWMEAKGRRKETEIRENEYEDNLAEFELYGERKRK